MLGRHFVVPALLALCLAAVVLTSGDEGPLNLAALERQAQDAAALLNTMGTADMDPRVDGALQVRDGSDTVLMQDADVSSSGSNDAAAVLQSKVPLSGAVLVAAGDIVGCDNPGAQATAKLLDGIPGTIATLGDSVYNSGTAEEFTRCYEPTWGRHRLRTRPVPGNHDYGTPRAAAYFAYFGAAAGDPTRGYYSYDLGSWHIVALNSNCGEVGGCQEGSPQERWLRADLATRPAACTLAYWHHARFSSGRHGDTPGVEPLWRALSDAGVEIVLSGHDHIYERFAPQDSQGRLDPDRGVRQFTVGTGGISLYGIKAPRANSEARNADTYGVLKLTLRPTSYDWEFIPVAGKTFTDSGSAACRI